jgi:hypothetical protein
MYIILIILLSLALLYLLGLAATLIVGLLVIRQRLRKYSEEGRFGY